MSEDRICKNEGDERHVIPESIGDIYNTVQDIQNACQGWYQERKDFQTSNEKIS